MTYYFMDILEKQVIAELTDSAQAQEMIQSPGPRYGLIETAIVLAAKDAVTQTTPSPAGGVDGGPDYSLLNVMGSAYTPLVVADVFVDYDILPAEIHCDASRYELVTDASGFVRDVNRITNTPPPNDFLRITTDATDSNPPDGYPDIPSDGVSTCRIMFQKVNGMTGIDMSAPEDSDLIEIRTQRGRLSAWQANLVNGYAEVTLTSSAETVITEVSVFDGAGQLGQQVIRIQFA